MKKSYMIGIILMMLTLPAKAYLPGEPMYEKYRAAIHFTMHLESAEVISQTPSNDEPDQCRISGTITKFIDGNEKSKMLNQIFAPVHLHHITMDVACGRIAASVPLQNILIMQKSALKGPHELDVWGELHLENEATYYFRPFEINIIQ